MIRNALLLIAVVCVAAFALPTVKITTPNGQNPPNGVQQPGTSEYANYNFQYVSMGKFEVTGAGDHYYNMSRSSPLDSVRQRGNSTAGAVKKPYRIKFNEKVPLFGREAAKSWVLLANHNDKTFAMTALAFRLGKMLGLEFTPTFEFVKLEICNPNGSCTNKGIYQLTEQVQAGEGRVDIGKKKGWLVEFNFHNPDANDIMITTNPYSIKAFVKSPEWEEFYDRYNGSAISSYPELTFVRDQLNGILAAVNGSQFTSGAYRDSIDITSYAKYLMIQQFMVNAEFANGDMGSNFAHRDNGGKMKAGPLWDFDLATNRRDGWTLIPFSHQTLSIEPHERLPFYKKFFDDPVFRARYRKLWEQHRSAIKALAANGGFIDSIAGVLKNDIAANYSAYSGGGSGPRDTAAYRQEITKLKNWWNDRYNHWNTTIESGTRFNVSLDVEDNNTTSVNGAPVKPARARVSVRPDAKGLIAALPANHAYTSYKLIDMRGREIKKGGIGAGVTDLRFDGVTSGVVFLNLRGKNGTKTLRAVTAR